MPEVPPSCVRVRVPAKLNLHLAVGAVRPDGFHELLTVFHAVDLCDVLTVRSAPALSVRVSGEGAGDVPTDSGNLAWRAAERLAAHAGVPADVAIEIDKAIPVAGGMAGGSADAAGTLLACARLWGVAEDELAPLAAELGSDVTFPLLGGTAIGTGRGEVLAPLAVSGSLHWVLVLADFGVSAAAAYRELDRLRDVGVVAPASDRSGPSSPAVGPMPDALASGDARAVAAALSNDLQPAALSLAPGLAEVLAAGTAAGALAGIVSGSGPTCAFLCADASAAAAVATRLEGYRTVLTHGPVPGATVVP
ncbi:MAG: 4-(cytidine 5'-diphospho)-2-C-methyl-D-erythritol kinase [Jatrophihabitantaceae bacterium]